MAFRPKLKIDFTKWSKNPKLTQFSEQLNGYETKVIDFVKDFDLKSREAKEKSRAHLDKFLVQLKKTRTNVEKKVTVLVNHESKRLNKGINELLLILKAVSQKEKLVKKPSKTKKKTTRTKSVSGKPSPRRRKTNGSSVNPSI